MAFGHVAAGIGTARSSHCQIGAPLALFRLFRIGREDRRPRLGVLAPPLMGRAQPGRVVHARHHRIGVAVRAQRRAATVPPGVDTTHVEGAEAHVTTGATHTRQRIAVVEGGVVGLGHPCTVSAPFPDHHPLVVNARSTRKAQRSPHQHHEDQQKGRLERRPRCLIYLGNLAEREGFEPSVRLHVLRFSRPAYSATLAPLRRPA